MPSKIIIFLLLTFSYGYAVDFDLEGYNQKIVKNVQKITIEGYPYTYNPSIVRYGNGYLLVFRVDAGPKWTPPYKVGIIKLDRHFNPASKPQILAIRAFNSLNVIKNEDPRILKVNDDFLVFYNEKWNDGFKYHNQMHCCKIKEINGNFKVLDNLLLTPPDEYPFSYHEKNWVPFQYGKSLLFGYSLVPHLIIRPNLATGNCLEICRSLSEPDWHWGELRGGTPAELVDGRYLAFFHSSIKGTSIYTNNEERIHYFMGAYTFRKDPPFAIDRISSNPIVGEYFYSDQTAPGNKHVVFPGGFVAESKYIYVVFGRNDNAIYLATLSKSDLFKSLIPVKE